MAPIGNQNMPGQNYFKVKTNDFGPTKTFLGNNKWVFGEKKSFGVKNGLQIYLVKQNFVGGLKIYIGKTVLFATKNQESSKFYIDPQTSAYIMYIKHITHNTHITHITNIAYITHNTHITHITHIIYTTHPFPHYAGKFFLMCSSFYKVFLFYFTE